MVPIALAAPGPYCKRVELTFSGTVLIWRGPAPHYFVRVPEDDSERLDAVRAGVTYGWGMIPVHATVGRTTWTTSLFPKDGGYLVPLRAATRRAEGIDVDDRIEITLAVGS